MKVLFVCDWDFTDLWSEVSKNLVKQEKNFECSALVVGKLWHEKLIKSEHIFKKVWLLQEHVENIENAECDLERFKKIDEEYGNPSVWRYLWADRSWVNESYENGVKLLVTAFDFYEKLYDEVKPDLIITNAFASMPHLVGFGVAEKRGIPVLSLLHTRFSSYCVPCYNAYNDIDWIAPYIDSSEKVSVNSVEIAARELERFRDRPVKPNYEALNTQRQGVDVAILFRFFRYCYRFYVNGMYSSDHTKKNPLVKLWMTVQPKVFRWGVSKLNIWDKWEKNTKYVYFPLHVQPEASTMTLAPFYLNQLSVVENLAKSVPYGMKVIVKEHPQMVGRRAVSFYKKLKSIVNVELVSPYEDNFNLIQKAELIFTLTGTAGFEGLMLKKPVITLGDVLYNKCSLVKQLNDVAPTQWCEHIKDMLDSYSHDEDVLMKYLSAIVENGSQVVCLEPNLAPEEILSNENVTQISEFVYKEIGRLG